MEKIPFDHNPEQKKSLPTVPTVEYFNKKENKNLKELILLGTKKIDKLAASPDPDLAQFAASEYFESIKIKYYLGEDFYDEIKKTIKFIDKQSSGPFPGIQARNYLEIFKIYKELNLPYDTLLEQSIKAVNELSIIDNFLIENIKKHKEEINLQEALKYLNEENLNSALVKFESIKDPLLRVQLLSEFAGKISDPIQKSRIFYLSRKILTAGSVAELETDNSLKSLVLDLVNNNELEEAEELIKTFDPKNQIEVFTRIAEKSNLSSSLKGSFIQRAMKILETEDPKHRECGTIAAFFANQGNIEKVQELFEKFPTNTPVDEKTKGGSEKSIKTAPLHSFLKGLSIEAFKNNDKTADFILSTLNLVSSEENSLESKDILNDGTMYNLFGKMGLSSEFMEKIIKHSFNSKSLLGNTRNTSNFLQGIHERLSFSKEKTYPEMKEFSLSKISYNTKAAFWVGCFVGAFSEEETESFPQHIKMAFDIGSAYREGSIESKYKLGSMYTPQDVRTFLFAMEQYKFETVPEAFEAILGSLPSEDDQIVYDIIAKEPEIARRLIKVLITIDSTKGTRFAQDLMKRKNTPDKVFVYFSRLCMEHGRFTKNLEPFLKEEENLSIIRIIASQYPNQFNNIFDILTQIGIDRVDTEEVLFDALADLKTLTPGIYKKYRSLPTKERKEFAQAVEEFDYSTFFRNKPITSQEDISENKLIDKDITTDLLYRAYNPVNMSYSTVKELLEKVADRTGDLKEYSFPESYNVAFKTPSYVLRNGETLNKESLEKLKDIFTEDQDIQTRNETFLKLIRATTDFTDKEIISLFSVLKNTPEVTTARNTFTSKLFEKDTFQNLSSLKEVFGVFATDNLGKELSNATKKEKLISEKVDTLLANPQRRLNLLNSLGHKKENELTEDIPTIQLAIELFVEKALSKYTILINKELRKFVQSEDEATTNKKAKAYISKNQGSFFAKASAGLCTSQDIPLWDLPNHFHINFVDESNTIKGNVMGFIEKISGENSLVLRGFNPTDQYLKEITAESFVEETLTIARKFNTDNDIKHLYFVNEGIGHAESNRGEVVRYLASKYFSKLPEVEHTMNVSGSGIAKKVFKLE